MSKERPTKTTVLAGDRQVHQCIDKSRPRFVYRGGGLKKPVYQVIPQGRPYKGVNRLSVIE